MGSYIGVQNANPSHFCKLKKKPKNKIKKNEYICISLCDLEKGNVNVALS